MRDLPSPDSAAAAPSTPVGHVEAIDRVAWTFLAQARDAGMRDVVISPGSRSTPLTLAANRLPGLTCWLAIDERAGGYFALGLARELGRPVGLICTSGTAAANYAPAVAEASLSRVPLVVCTADRPPELRGVGANQVIDQVRMFGSHAKWSVELPLADGSAAVERHARMTAARAVALAAAAPAGPVHLNVPLREPLVERRVAPPTPAAGETRVLGGVPRLEGAALAEVAAHLSGRRGVLVCGPQTGGLPAAEIAALAAALDWPVFADPLSGLRLGAHDRARVVDLPDLVVRSEALIDRYPPEVVLRFGAVPTSKPLFAWLGRALPAGHVVVDRAPGPAWRDQEGAAALLVRADEASLARDLLPLVSPAPPVAPAVPWSAPWLAAGRAARDRVTRALDALDEPFEGRVPVEVAAALPGGGTLAVGNSMPVRDVDTFLPQGSAPLRVVGTRGASGIDGVISAAAGAAAARRAEPDGGAAPGGPVVLVVGDLSFLHDLGGLWFPYRYGLDLVVVLVHNDGGGIFSLLPQATAAGDEFEPWFGTPHGLQVRGAVEMYGGRYQRLDGAAGWADAIAAAAAAGGLHVLELRTDRGRNVTLHREIAAAALAAVAAAVAALPVLPLPPPPSTPPGGAAR